MPVSLYGATVPTFIQVAGSVGGLLDKAEAFCNEQGIEPAELIQARLIEDMWPFAMQIRSVHTFSLFAIDAIRNGLFTKPDYDDLASDFAGLRDTVQATLAGLHALEEADLEACLGKPMHFHVGNFEMDFIAEDFLLSFAQPNFFFHATTAYDLLRGRGVPLGKFDYLGSFRRLPESGSAA